MSTIFDDIVNGKMKSWVVWQDDSYMAFLSPYPNTPGFTAVIPKKNTGDYVFNMADEDYIGLMNATKIVAKKLEKAFDTPRVAMVFEGTGVAHVHAKLIPLHGALANETDIWSKHQEFYPEYPGYLSTVEGPLMADAELDEIKKRVTSV